MWISSLLFWLRYNSAIVVSLNFAAPSYTYTYNFLYISVIKSYISVIKTDLK